jgi:hypothetical protein
MRIIANIALAILEFMQTMKTRIHWIVTLVTLALAVVVFMQNCHNHQHYLDNKAAIEKNQQELNQALGKHGH